MGKALAGLLRGHTPHFYRRVSNGLVDFSGLLQYVPPLQASLPTCETTKRGAGVNHQRPCIATLLGIPAACNAAFMVELRQGRITKQKALISGSLRQDQLVWPDMLISLQHNFCVAPLFDAGRFSV